MARSIKLYTPLALLVALVLVISGCSAGQQVTAADIIAKMQETAKNTQTSQNVVDIAITLNKDGIKALAQTFAASMGKGTTDASGGSGEQAGGRDMTAGLPDSLTATIKTWKQSPDKGRIEIAKSSLPGASGVTAVYDGSKLYAYVASNNTYYTGTPDQMDQIPDSMKSMMQSGDMQAQLDKLIAAADVKLLGNEQVAGVDTYKLDITPKADAVKTLGLPEAMQLEAGLLAKDLHVTMWVDKDRWVPLKVTLEHPSLGQFTATTTQLDLNKTIDASQFTLPVPNGAKQVDLDALKAQMTPKSITLPEAKTAATAEGWQLLEPSYVPNNATLVDVRALPAMMSHMNNGQTSGTAAKGSTFLLSYKAATTDLSIVESKAQHPQALGEGGMMSGAPTTSSGTTQVSLRGVTATAFSPESSGWTALTWQEKNNGIWVSVYGKMTLAEATKVAESLK